MITYPVDPNIPEWSQHDASTGEIVYRNRTWPQADGGEITTLDEGLTMLRQVYGPKPVDDPALNKVVADEEIVDLVNNELIQNYSLESLSVDDQNTHSRATQRQDMRDYWDSLPPYIKGPYKDKFEAANSLLSEGDDDSAAELIAAIKPTDKIIADANGEQAVFDTTLAAFAASMAALTPIQ